MKYWKFFKKWKIAVSALFILCAPASFSTPHPEYGLTNQVVSAALCLLIAVGLLLPDILYIRTPAAALWKRWGAVEGQSAERRKGRASYGELTPVRIDADLKYGTFAGTAGGEIPDNAAILLLSGF